MGVPLPRGLRCQGSACYGEMGHCPESLRWRNQDGRGREGGGTGGLRTGFGRREGESTEEVQRRRICTFSPKKGHQEKERYGVRRNLFCYSYVLFVYVIGF